MAQEQDWLTKIIREAYWAGDENRVLFPTDEIRKPWEDEAVAQARAAILAHLAEALADEELRAYEWCLRQAVFSSDLEFFKKELESKYKHLSKQRLGIAEQEKP